MQVKGVRSKPLATLRGVEREYSAPTISFLKKAFVDSTS